MGQPARSRLSQAFSPCPHRASACRCAWLKGSLHLRKKERRVCGQGTEKWCLQCSALACHCYTKAVTFGALVCFRAERGRWSCRGACRFPPRRACQGFVTSLFKSIMSCSLRKASTSPLSVEPVSGLSVARGGGPAHIGEALGPEQGVLAGQESLSIT